MIAISCQAAAVFRALSAASCMQIRQSTFSSGYTHLVSVAECSVIYLLLDLILRNEHGLNVNAL